MLINNVKELLIFNVKGYNFICRLLINNDCSTANRVVLFQLMLHLPYSRKLEREADKVGLDLAARVCWFHVTRFHSLV